MKNKTDIKFFAMAYDYPLKCHSILNCILTHEEEFGFFDTLKEAINFCIDMSKVMNHPIDLFYISKYIEDESIYHKSIIEF